MINYAESGDENDDEDVFEPEKPSNTRGRALKRRKTVVNDEDDFSHSSEADMVDEGSILVIETVKVLLVTNIYPMFRRFYCAGRLG